ncbi:class I SAM-dependent DNA methyltransferase [Tessaracoccus antarcticus]|uniref:class I SAM-dependent DNA methyltransferase n=1 Tax=Tessaracoccus antarcticus TaxID=2479848 RepID=UPI00131486A1|nr:class I SAM-dependent methyltransferase [Tessaracoccus antarcticus]
MTQRVRATYDALADAYDHLVGDVSVEAPIDLAMVQLLVDQVGNSTGASILDAGCGAGRMMAHLHHLDPTVVLTGIDLSQGMVARARTHHPSLRIDQADLALLPFAEDTFDGVLSWYSIIHTPQQALERILSEFGRVLRPGGALLLGFHVGAGERRIHHAYGRDLELTVQMHEIQVVRSSLEGGGFHMRASLEREARASEKGPQGFLLATRG